MRLKKFLQKFAILLLAIFSMPLSIFAYSDFIIPGGQNIGIELHSDGILVVGFYEVDGKKTWESSGIKIGDKIVAINGVKVNSIDEMVTEISKRKNQSKISLSYLRNGKEIETNLPIYQDNEGITKTGLYVKDSITGIGTLTYIDPNTKLFGALGHEIQEKTTGKILEIKDGKIFESNVTSITKSNSGNPGAKNAKFYFDQVKGSIKENTDKGIFGTYTEQIPSIKAYKVAKPNDVKVGNAWIKTVLNGNEIETYQIHIDEINYNKGNKNLTFTITDQNLLNQTGGIIQGMSGSPILQGEYIVGAVTHVVVDSPNKGYGIFITNMLEEAEN